MVETVLTPSPWKTFRRGLRWMAIGGGVLIGLWCGWYAYAEHLLSARLADYRARGEPASARDLIPPPLAAGDDAYQIAIDARASLALTRDEIDIVDGPARMVRLSLPLTDAEMATARAMVLRHGASAALINRLAATPRAAWPIDASKGVLASGHMGDLRRLASYQRTSALFLHQDHQDKNAIEALRSIFAMADVYDQYPLMINHLLAVGCNSLAAQALIHIAPDLEIQSASVPRGVSREEVQAVIRQLVERGARTETMRSALRGDRIFYMADVQFHTKDNPLLRPLFDIAICRELDGCDATLAAINPTVTNFQAAKSGFVVLPDLLSSNIASMSNLYRGGFAGGKMYVTLHYRGMGDLDAAAVRLALRLYESDHGGKAAETLQALVPAYLPALPADPFRADGKPFVYAPERRLFYSVGEDGIDDGGAVPTSQNIWRAPDAVFLMDRPTPAPAH